MPSIRVPEVIRVPNKNIRVTEGVQISEDSPAFGGVRVAEGIRILDRKKLKLPDPKKSSARTSLINRYYWYCNIFIDFLKEL